MGQRLRRMPYCMRDITKDGHPYSIFLSLVNARKSREMKKSNHTERKDQHIPLVLLGKSKGNLEVFLTVIIGICRIFHCARQSIIVVIMGGNRIIPGVIGIFMGGT